MTIQIGLNGRFYSQNWRPALREIEFARDNGFKAIQFPGPEMGLGRDRLGDKQETVATSLRQFGITPVMEMLIKLDENGRTESGLTPGDVLQANLPAITMLGCPYVHMHLETAYEMPKQTLRSLETACLPYLHEGVLLAETHGFQFGLEHNAPGVPTNNLFDVPERIRYALSQVPGLKFVWDFNHTHPDHLAEIQMLAGQVSMLHVSDMPLSYVHHHLPVGKGSIDFASNCRVLRLAEFSGPAILEIGGTPWSGGLGQDTDEALVDSLHRFRHAIADADYSA
jgi:sugar phosphate isomerase/epimerase